MAIAERKEGSKVTANINVTPMVDVMLVLLIIFMVVTPMLQKGVPGVPRDYGEALRYYEIARLNGVDVPVVKAR